jgi:LmbE family N-acetylglucosaminyl deacetylase
VFATRILVLIPHPDDEIVGCGAAILRARRHGSRIFGLYLSNGVPAPENDWPWRRRRNAVRVARRWREAEAVRAQLGMVEAARLDAPTRTLRSRMIEAQGALERALTETQAEMIWCPAFEGAHQDHDAASALASRFTARVPVWEFAEYNNIGGRTHSQEFPNRLGGEIVLDLAPGERKAKRELLVAYASEHGNLAHIGAARESFRPLPKHDYARPPHEGKLFYTRYRWVPFHPRVDRTDPVRVYEALGSFLAAPPPR